MPKVALVARFKAKEGKTEELIAAFRPVSVGALEGDVVHPLRPGELAGPLDGGRGDVHPERAACPGYPRGLTGRLPAPASDVQDLLAGLDPPRPAQYLIVQPQFGVVVSGTGPVHHGSHLRSRDSNGLSELLLSCSAYEYSRQSVRPASYACGGLTGGV